MMKSSIITILSWMILQISGPISAQDFSTLANYKLRNTNGEWFSINDLNGAKGVILIFTCNHCPFAKLYTQRLNELHQNFSKLGVPILAINPMDTLVYDDERFALMKTKSEQEGFLFPYLQDNLQLLARSFNAQHTPQAFVLWKVDDHWEIEYQGAIDDNGAEPEKAKSYIADAVSALLSGKDVKLKKTDSFGCRIYYRSAN